MDGFGSVAIGNLETFVVDPPDAVTVSRTDSTFPLAVAGTISDSRATPALREFVCATSFRAMVGLKTIFAPVALITLYVTVKRRPGIAFAGAATSFPITGLPTVEAIGVPLAAATNTATTNSNPKAVESRLMGLIRPSSVQPVRCRLRFFG